MDLPFELYTITYLFITLRVHILFHRMSDIVIFLSVIVFWWNSIYKQRSQSGHISAYYIYYHQFYIHILYLQNDERNGHSP